MTVIYELSRRHELAGGETRVIVGRGTRHDYTVGECTEVNFSALPDRNRKIADALMGRVGLRRHFLANVYRPAFEAVPRDFEGVIVVHNAPVAMRGIKAAAPDALAALYCHNTLFGTYSHAETRRALAPADRIICVSKFLADELKMRLGSDDPRVFGITNGVDTSRFCPSPARAETDESLVLYVGRVSPEKGPDLLVSAAVKLADGRRKFKVRIVGSSNFNALDPLTSYEKSLRAIAAQAPGIVEFVPFVDRSRILEQYRQASIFCAPSNCDEGCSLTVPEAMACGIPTVASRRGGIPEVGGDAIQYFVPPDTGELADVLAGLIDDPHAREEWGALARKQAESISWEHQYQRVCKALFD